MNCLDNNQKNITFVVSIKQDIMNKELRKEKKKLKKELEYYLDYYKEVAWRAPQVKEFFDEEINRIVERLKEIGK